ncbi:hypothetical protein PRIPAC_97408 [Pristionchus pacificus]|uniref:Uncharacterized protein n=1 Tax=Pristionchus pacificus TaxID=54126 RepID=A0A2A6CUB4_PRIPA|nr:hypothetical protein PRIPAC_97408 [Pristionchus pacificus]|eukprot:PDM81647.1 hypothetical protein PRIPAC_30628 [Pristionchus pacificus]
MTFAKNQCVSSPFVPDDSLFFFVFFILSLSLFFSIFSGSFIVTMDIRYPHPDSSIQFNLIQPLTAPSSNANGNVSANVVGRKVLHPQTEQDFKDALELVFESQNNPSRPSSKDSRASNSTPPLTHSQTRSPVSQSEAHASHSPLEIPSTVSSASIPSSSFQQSQSTAHFDVGVAGDVYKFDSSARTLNNSNDDWKSNLPQTREEFDSLFAVQPMNDKSSHSDKLVQSQSSATHASLQHTVVSRPTEHNTLSMPPRIQHSATRRPLSHANLPPRIATTVSPNHHSPTSGMTVTQSHPPPNYHLPPISSFWSPPLNGTNLYSLHGDQIPINTSLVPQSQSDQYRMDHNLRRMPGPHIMFTSVTSLFSPTVSHGANRPIFSHSTGAISPAAGGNRPFTAQSTGQSAHGPTPITGQVKRKANGSSTVQTLPFSAGPLPSSVTMAIPASSSLPSAQVSSAAAKEASEKSQGTQMKEAVRAPRRVQKHRSYFKHVFFNITTVDRIHPVRPHEVAWMSQYHTIILTIPWIEVRFSRASGRTKLAQISVIIVAKKDDESGAIRIGLRHLVIVPQMARNLIVGLGQQKTIQWEEKEEEWPNRIRRMLRIMKEKETNESMYELWEQEIIDRLNEQKRINHYLFNPQEDEGDSKWTTLAQIRGRIWEKHDLDILSFPNQTITAEERAIFNQVNRTSGLHKSINHYFLLQSAGRQIEASRSLLLTLLRESTGINSQCKDLIYDLLERNISLGSQFYITETFYKEIIFFLQTGNGRWWIRVNERLGFVDCVPPRYVSGPNHLSRMERVSNITRKVEEEISRTRQQQTLGVPNQGVIPANSGVPEQSLNYQVAGHSITPGMRETMGQRHYDMNFIGNQPSLASNPSHYGLHGSMQNSAHSAFPYDQREVMGYAPSHFNTFGNGSQLTNMQSHSDMNDSSSLVRGMGEENGKGWNGRVGETMGRAISSTNTVGNDGQLSNIHHSDSLYDDSCFIPTGEGNTMGHQYYIYTPKNSTFLCQPTVSNYSGQMEQQHSFQNAGPSMTFGQWANGYANNTMFGTVQSWPNDQGSSSFTSYPYESPAVPQYQSNPMNSSNLQDDRIGLFALIGMGLIDWANTSSTIASGEDVAGCSSNSKNSILRQPHQQYSSRQSATMQAIHPQGFCPTERASSSSTSSHSFPVNLHLQSAIHNPINPPQDDNILEENLHDENSGSNAIDHAKASSSLTPSLSPVAPQLNSTVLPQMHSNSAIQGNSLPNIHVLQKNSETSIRGVSIAFSDTSDDPQIDLTGHHSINLTKGQDYCNSTVTGLSNRATRSSNQAMTSSTHIPSVNPPLASTDQTDIPNENSEHSNASGCISTGQPDETNVGTNVLVGPTYQSSSLSSPLSESPADSTGPHSSNHSKDQAEQILNVILPTESSSIGTNQPSVHFLQKMGQADTLNEEPTLPKQRKRKAPPIARKYNLRSKPCQDESTDSSRKDGEETEKKSN